ncbi:hypothetical protein SprV_0100152300 [Sparganum proliferum]
MQDTWTARKAEGIQRHVDRSEWRSVFSVIKTVYGTPTKVNASRPNADGSTILTEKRWAEHIRAVLNRPSTTFDVAIARLPQVETNFDLDLPPFLHEIIRVVQQLSSGKAPGSDAIPAEVYKHGSPQLMDHLIALFQEMWQQDLLPESQCGLCRFRGTTDMIFAARQLQEKCQEMRTHLYSTFVDLTKAFDTVNREGLWKMMLKFGCPERFTQMVRQLHDGMIARVTDNGAVSKVFAVTNGVKEGCVLAPTLVSLIFSAILMDAYRDERPGVRITYRTDGQLLNQRRIRIHNHRPRTFLCRQLRPPHHLGKGHAKEDGSLLRRLPELRPDQSTRHWENLARDRSTDLEEDSEDRRSDLRGKPHRRCENQTSSTQISAAPTSRSQRPAVPTCLRCDRTFRAPTGLVGHLRTNCNTRTAPTVASPSTSPSSPEPPLPSSSSSTASTSAAVASPMHINMTHNPGTPSNTNTATADTSGEDQDDTCPHCDRIFTSHISLGGHLRIHLTETGEPVPRAPTCTHRIRLHCPHNPRTFMHRMGLFGHIRIHDNLRQTTAGCTTPRRSPCLTTI